MSDFNLYSLFSKSNLTKASCTGRPHTKFLAVITLLTLIAVSSIIAPAQSSNQVIAAASANNFAVHQPILAAGFWDFFSFLGFGSNDGQPPKPQHPPIPSILEDDENTAETNVYYASTPQPSLANSCTATNVTLNVPGTYPTIQSAINAANANGGDTIKVAAGMYVEQLVIGKCVTITGDSRATTIIKSPGSLANSTVSGATAAQSIVEVNGNYYVTMSKLTVTGPVNFTSASNGFGIFVLGGSTLNLSDVAVTSIRENPFSGNQRGLAIAAGRVSLNQIGSLILDNVSVTDYQKGGIYVDGQGSTTTINRTTVTGAGETTVTAQNGIQISRGATGTITNSTVSGNSYTGSANATATGIVIVNAGATSISNNTFTGNEAAVFNSVNPIPATLPAFTINGNTFNNNTNATNGGYGVILQGASGDVTNNFITNSDYAVLAYAANNSVVNINSNSITNSAGAGIYITNSSGTTTTAQLTANFNRISNNFFGAYNGTSSPFNAENNFWGCNQGPNGGTGCDETDSISDLTPYLILSHITTSQPSVGAGNNTATITTNLRYNSDNVDTYSTLPGNPHLPNPIPATPPSANSPGGIPVNFTATNGTVNPAVTPLVDGLASTIFTGGGPFSGNQTAVVTAQVDNATDSVNVMVNDTTKPDVTVNQASGQPDPTNVSPVNFTAVFTEVVTGFDASDVDTTGSTATVPVGGIVITNPSNDGKTYNIAVSPTSNGFVKVSIPANAALDPANNGNNASTSTDNMVSYFAGSIELVVDDQGINCLNNSSPVYTTFQGAVAASSNGYTIRVCSGNYPFASTVNITQMGLTIIKAEATRPVIQVPQSTGYAFTVNASNVTLDNLEIVKSDDTAGPQNLIYVNANNFTAQNNYVHGPDWRTLNAVTRGFEVTSGLTGLLITGNTIESLRQPAYINGSGAGSPVIGTISNNTVTGTKGFVVAGASVNFTGNTFGQTCPTCGADIALLSNVDPAFYTPSNLLTISTNNDDAYISVQFPTNPSPSGRAVTFVNKSAAAGGDGRSANPRQTIQDGVNNTLPGGTVNVAAGTYTENITVNRQLNILGPNAANDPNTGTRGAEAVLYSAVSNPTNNNCNDNLDAVIVTLAAEGVVFKGFTLDGNNPALTSNYVFNGSDIDAYAAIFGPGTTNPNADLSYNIVKNMGEFGIVLSGDANAAGARTGISTISRNKVDNVVGLCFGEAIRAGENAFANVTDNVVTKSFNGVTIENFNSNLGAHPSATVSNNQLTAFGYALYFNLHYGYSGNGYTLTGNTINAYAQADQGMFADPAKAKAENVEQKGNRLSQFVRKNNGNAPSAVGGFDRYIGIRLESINGAVPVTVSNNTIVPDRAALLADGYTVIDGIRITNPSTTSTNIAITGNTISNAKRGIDQTSPAVPNVMCNNITSNDVGIYVGNGIDYNGNTEYATNGITANNNNIFGNSIFGVQSDTTGINSPVATNAKMNYWGATDGPGPVGPGSGDKVSTNVDFSNFLTSPSTCTVMSPMPTVTINQAAGQNDPTNVSPITFTVVFSEPVSGFDASDVIVTGSAFGTGATPVVTVTPVNGSTYTVTVSGMNQSGTVTARIPAGAATGADGANVASTSMDNTVFFNFVAVNPTTIIQPVNPVNIITQQFAFLNEGATGSGAFVTGPATPPGGIGSVQLTVDGTGRENLVTARYGGTRLADISALQYSAYTNRTDNLTIVLAFDVDYDLTDTNYAYQNRLVYEPAAQGIAVAQNTWQTFDTLAGKFYSSNDTNPGGQAGCTQATPCTKTQLLALFPNVGIFGGANAPFQGGLYLRAGGPFPGGLVANADNLVVGINGNTTTFDFEPSPPTISIDDVSVTEGGTANFTVTQSVASQLDTTFTVNAGGGTATAGTDYNAITNQTFTIPAGSTTLTVTVPVTTISDTTPEPDETFNVNLSNALNAAIADGQGVGTITNDDVVISFSSATYSVTEGTPTATITVTRNGVTPNTVKVGYATSDGTATAGSDYTATSGTLTFGPNDTTMTFSVPITDDTLSEFAETVNLTLSNVTGGAALGISSAVLTITDNDGGGTITISGQITQDTPNSAGLDGVTVTLTGTNVPANTTTVTSGGGFYSFTGLTGNATSPNNYLITPSLAGKVFDPKERSYVNLGMSVTNANFVAYNPGAIPRNLRVINTSQSTISSNVTVPIVLDSLGNENGTSFSLNYNSSLLTFSSIACGSDAPNCSVSINNNTPGMLGVEFTRADDAMNNPTTFTAGNGRQVVLVTFTTTPGTASNTPITFGDVPTLRDINDVDGNSLQVNYIGGLAIFAQGFEGDVAPRPTGNGALSGADVTTLRTFVAGTATPVIDATVNEFQRADVAPAGSKGGGTLTSADVTVLRNYLANSILTPAGGPNQMTASARPLNVEKQKTGSQKNLIAGGDVRVVNTNTSAGSTVMVPIVLSSSGNENGFTFSIQFDQSKLTYIGTAPGADFSVSGDLLDTNVTQLASGRVGISGTRNVGQTFMPGDRQLVIVTFTVAANAPAGVSPITFVDQPLPRELNDAAGNTVPSNFIQTGGVNIAGPLAAAATIGGRVISESGNRVVGALVTLTDSSGSTRSARVNPLGYYQFDDVPTGGAYIINVSSKSYTGTPQVITVVEDVSNLDFVLKE